MGNRQTVKSWAMFAAGVYLARELAQIEITGAQPV